MNTNNENARGTDAPPPAPDRFPFVTVGVSAGSLFAFLFLMWFVSALPNAADDTKPGAVKGEPTPNAAAKLDELKERNESALNGVGAKMSRAEARGKLLGMVKGPDDTLPFPTPPKTDEPKKDDKK